MGGWVDREVEENEAVGMRCCGLGVGGWVGGWVVYLQGFYFFRPLDFLELGIEVGGGELLGYVGGWVGGWVGGLFFR